MSSLSVLSLYLAINSIALFLALSAYSTSRSSISISISAIILTSLLLTSTNHFQIAKSSLFSIQVESVYIKYIVEGLTLVNNGEWLSNIVISQTADINVIEITSSELKLSHENDNIFNFIIFELKY